MARDLANGLALLGRIHLLSDVLVGGVDLLALELVVDVALELLITAEVGAWLVGLGVHQAWILVDVEGLSFVFLQLVAGSRPIVVLLSPAKLILFKLLRQFDFLRVESSVRDNSRRVHLVEVALH